MTYVGSILSFLLALAAAPVLPGVIHRVKALFAGRRGPPVLQLYFDLWKLLHKGAVYSRTTSWLIKAGPIVSVAAVVSVAAIVPLCGLRGVLSFEGDLVLVAYLLGLMRFFTVLAALDTGSPFEGMGASREVAFSMLAEPALLLGLAALARQTGSLSLSGIYGALTPAALAAGGAAMLMAAGAFAIVLLAENARIPVDDPNTHLELTMIHEVMVLDHGGVDFAFIQYAAAVKLWVLSCLLVGLVVPLRTAWAVPDLLAGAAGLLAIAAGVGVVESVMARLKLLRVPQLLVGATVLAALAMVLVRR